MNQEKSFIINFLKKQELVFAFDNFFIKKIRNKSYEFFYSTHGSIIVEFVYILPFMFLLWFGTVIASEGVNANRKVVLLSYTIGDMISQSTKISQVDLDSIFEASTNILWPFQSSMIALRVTSYRINEKGEAYVSWSAIPSNSKMAGRFNTISKCQKAFNLENKIIVKSSDVLFIEAEVTYTSSIGASMASNFYANSFMDSTVPIVSRVYTKPRQAIKTNTLSTFCTTDPYKQ